ncbi:MAG: hypothetical protein ACI4JX_01075 [Oscillospiraceae bacterium]
MIRKCVECGRKFKAPPTSKKITCSPECSKKRRSRLLMGHKVTKEARQKISEKAAKQDRSKNLSKGTEASKASPWGGRFETNSAAKDWVIISPEGAEYSCTNLLNFIRENCELFDFENSDENAKVIYRRFLNLKKRVKKGETNATTLGGWTLGVCGDLKNCEKEGYKK